MSTSVDTLERRIDTRAATVAVVGMGYVGLSLAQVGQQALERRQDERDVGLLALPQRRRDADDQDVAGSGNLEGRRGGKAAFPNQGRKGLASHVDEVRRTPVQETHPLHVQVDAVHPEARSA